MIRALRANHLRDKLLWVFDLEGERSKALQQRYG